jgi:outer membrane protein assembly factor BamB
LKSGALPTPVVGNNMVYCMTGYQEYSLVAIELGHKGDLTGTDAVKWTLDKNTPYVPSPMLSEDRLYFTSGMRAALSCYNAITGEPHYETERLEGLRQMYSSPAAANGYVYIAGRRGGIIVLKDAPEYEVVSTITMEDGFDASPVVAGDEIFLRGENYLYCIAEQ